MLNSGGTEISVLNPIFHSKTFSTPLNVDYFLTLSGIEQLYYIVIEARRNGPLLTFRHFSGILLFIKVSFNVHALAFKYRR